MALSDLFGQNAIIRWLAGDSSRVDLAVAMTGVKLGERVLLAGCHDPRLVAAIGARTGLSGHVVGLDPDEGALVRLRKTAATSGVLIELERAPTTMMPFDAGSFDVVVAGTTEGPAQIDQPRETLAEIVRVLRPGGRLVVVQQAPRGGVVGHVRDTVAPGDPGDLRALMTAAGLRGVRILAERDHLQFFEGGRGQ